MGWFVRNPTLSALLGLGLCMALWGFSQRDRGQVVTRPRSSQSIAGRRDTGGLFESIKTQLRNLPGEVQMDLFPPQVLLDSRSSANGEEVQSIVVPVDSNAPDCRLVIITSDNARLGELGVTSGDIVKYYNQVDEETLDAIGVEKVTAIDLEVGQALGGVKFGDQPHEALMLSRGLEKPELTPRRTEIWRIADDKMQTIDSALGRYVKTGEPRLAWTPTGEQQGVDLLAERLNQWLRPQSKPDAWTVTELTTSWPEELRSAEDTKPYLADNTLESGEFSHYDVRVLQETTWLRGVSQWARGESLDPIDQATELFDWTVRNLILVDDLRTFAYRPWDALAMGQGEVAHRAWVFCGLCRQLGVDSCVLEVPTDSKTPYLLCGVLHEGELWLYDPVVGLPLPGGTKGRPATLSETLKSGEALRGWDLDGETPYPVTSEALGKATLALVADPLELSFRAQALERGLTGIDQLRLHYDVDAAASRIRKAAGVGEKQQVTLWSTPPTILQRKLRLARPARGAAVEEALMYCWRPALWKARLLHLRGVLDADEEKIREDPLYDPINDHRAALGLYANPNVRPSETVLREITGSKAAIYRQAKIAATYFLGLLSYDEGNLEAAKNWFENETFQADAAERYRSGVQFNLARVYERLEQPERAAELLEQDRSPGRLGSLLRAKALRSQGSAESAP